MIFRLNGGVENVLALTPVLEEWTRRNGGTMKVETRFPELFWGNSLVEEAAESVDSEENHVELAFVRWPLIVKSVTVAYAEKVLGDTNMGSWRTRMFSSIDEEREARNRMPKGKVAAVSLGKGELDPEVELGILEAVREAGYGFVDLEMEDSLRLKRAMIAEADLFVGVDGPVSSLAYTTDVPAVVVHTWRDPMYFWPFRRGIPFAALAPSEPDCSMARVCMASNGLSEYGKVYGCRCPMEPAFKCRRVRFDIMVRKALDNMFLVS